jgi:hypothetical protein
MKLSVVKDQHGKVVATFEHDAPGGRTIKPALKPGHTVHVVDAPDDYKKDMKTLKAFYDHHSR